MKYTGPNNFEARRADEAIDHIMERTPSDERLERLTKIVGALVHALAELDVLNDSKLCEIFDYDVIAEDD